MLSGYVNDHDIEVLIKRCDKLKQLSLNNCGGVTSTTMVNIINCCPNIEKLDITGASFYKKFEDLFKLKALKKLKVFNMWDLDKQTEVEQSVDHLRRELPLIDINKEIFFIANSDEPLGLENGFWEINAERQEKGIFLRDSDDFYDSDDPESLWSDNLDECDIFDDSDRFDESDS